MTLSDSTKDDLRIAVGALVMTTRAISPNILWRFLHIIHEDGTDHWQELRDDEVTFDIKRTDIHCLWATFDPSTGPDHCAQCELRMLEDDDQE